MALSRVNAVVVGAGAAGGVVAKELVTAGLNVVLLERGQWQTFQDNDHDELISCLLYTSPSPRDRTRSRMPSFA